MSVETKEALKSGAIGAFMGLLMSFLINYFIVPLPTSVMAWP